MRKNGTLILLAGLLIMILILGISCVGASAPRTITETTFIIVEATEPGTIDPHKIGTGGTAFTCESLNIWSLNDYSLTPCLASSWEPIDASTWKFTLNKGIKFSNGDVLTSADVQFSCYRLMGKYDPKFIGYRQSVFTELIDSVDTPDESTVIFHLRRAEVSFPYVITAVNIAPKNYIQKVGDAEFGRLPIGTGPYNFKERKISEYLTMEANPSYWNTNPLPGQRKRPNIKTIIIRYAPEESTRIATLKAGEVDAATGISNDNAKELEKGPNLNVYYTNVNSPYYVLMNWQMERDPNTGDPNPFLDVRVRQAMNYALDIDAIIKNYGTDHEYRTTMLGKGGLGYNPKAIIYSYNPDKARQLLREAGYPNGFSTKWYSPTITPNYEAMQKYWMDVGINAQFQVATQPVITRQIQTKKLYGITVFAAAWGADPMSNLIEGMVKYDATNSLHGKDPKAEELALRGKNESDAQKRAKIYDEIIQIVWKDAWVVPLWEPVAIRAISTKWDYDNPAAAAGVDFTSLRPKK